ncbi:MAG: LamG domain-containing protein, partial [Flavobacteriales bacterium]|nr:LamG domain-containing protein [Flavobacteriales bacterium]
MKKTLLSITAITVFAFGVSAQITDLPVSANPTEVCSGSSSIISTTGSQTGVDYSLRNSSNLVIDGPIAGTGGNLNFNTGALTSAKTFNVFAVSGSSLTFDGVDDWINTTGNSRGIVLEGSISCWVKTNVSGSTQYLISKYSPGAIGYFLSIDANGKASFDGRSGSFTTTVYSTTGPSTTSVNDGQWRYIVGTMWYDSGAGEVNRTIYVDGVLENSVAISSAGTITNSSTPLVFGTQSGTYFSGSMDEVTIWSVALDASAIANNYTSCLAGNETGLTGYYNFDEGSGIIVYDTSPTALGVGITNFASTAWTSQSNSGCIASSSLQMSQTAAVSVVTINDETVSGPASICTTGSATVSTGSSAIGIDYSLIDGGGNLIDGPIPGTGNALNLNTGAFSSTTTYSVVGEILSSINNQLNFDGTDDFVDCTNNNRGITNQVSLSCWMKTTASGTTQFLISKYDFTRGYLLVMNASGQVTFDGKAAGSYFTSGASTTIVNDGQWHYITGTVTVGSPARIYVDGALEASSANTNGGTLGGTSILSIGSYTTNFANVDIDGVSLWDTELDLTAIQANMNNCLTGSETNLVGLFNFNAKNTTALTDHSSLAIDGTLTNMSSSAWIPSNANSCTSLFAECSLTMTQTVTISPVDNTPPAADITTLANVNDQCSITSLTAPTATDNCVGSIAGTHNATFPITSNTTITWTYDDGNGNTSTQTQDVVLNDVTAPIVDVATLSDVTAECEVTALTAPTATDNCLGTITGTHNASFPITSNTTIIWTYDDGSGNTASQTQDIVLNDITTPVPDVTNLLDVISQCEITSLTAPTADDNCSGPIMGTHNATFPITSNTIITWTYDDGNGNASTQTQDVVLNDNIAPVEDVATLADVTAVCSVTSLTDPTATDNCSGSITGTHNATFPITSNTTITWTYNDGNGNTSTQTQEVVLTDNVAPIADVATLADITAVCSVTSLTAPTATDNCSGSVTGTHTTTFPITSNTTITWTYDDGNGNTSTQTQDVVITDVTAPVADVATLTDATGQCSVAAITAPTATDNCVGGVTATTTATFPITGQGTTTITWTYDD